MTERPDGYIRCPRCRERFYTDNEAWAKCPGCGRRLVLDESNPYMGGGDEMPSWYQFEEFQEERLNRPGWSV